MLEKSGGGAGHVEWTWPRASREADAGGALGAGPGVSEVAGAREVQERGHGTMMRLSQCWGGGGGTHFAPRWSEIHVFPLEIKAPTRPGSERLIGQSQCPRSGERQGPGQSQGLQERRVWGSRTPSCEDSCETGGRG